MERGRRFWQTSREWTFFSHFPFLFISTAAADGATSVRRNSSEVAAERLEWTEEGPACTLNASVDQILVVWKKRLQKSGLGQTGPKQKETVFKLIGRIQCVWECVWPPSCCIAPTLVQSTYHRLLLGAHNLLATLFLFRSQHTVASPLKRLIVYTF